MIDYEIRRANREPSPESALFGVQRWIDNETPIGEDIPLLRLKGEGKWVGLFANLGSVNTARRDYLEGDERVFLDDSLHPEIYGTGTEDIFNGGFYFDKGPFRLALHGAPYHHFLDNGEDETAMYRLMLTDGISFASSITAGLEGGPTGNLSLRAHRCLLLSASNSRFVSGGRYRPRESGISGGARLHAFGPLRDSSFGRAV